MVHSAARRAPPGGAALSADGFVGVPDVVRRRIPGFRRRPVDRMASLERGALDVVSAGIAGSALGVIEAWLARDPRPRVETAADWVWRVLVGVGDAMEEGR